MQPEQMRTAFTLSPVHRRRDNLRVTAVALHQRAGRIYLGLDNGVLEEHRISPSSAHQAAPVATAHQFAPPLALQQLQLRLQAEKHLFRSAVAALAIALSAARVAAMSGDGQVSVLRPVLVGDRISHAAAPGAAAGACAPATAGC